MIMTKFLIPLFFLGLLAGCVTPCPAPGQPNLSDEICQYKLEITDVDKNTGMVKGKIPETVLEANKASGARVGKVYDLSNYPRNSEYEFSVDDASGIAIGDVLEFHRAPSSMTETYTYSKNLEQHKTPCPAPGHPNLSGETCNYKLKITFVDEKTGMLRGTVPPSVLDANKASGARVGKVYDLSTYPKNSEYVFSVDDASGIAIGDVLEFHKAPSSMTGSSTNALERGKGNNGPQ